MAIPRPAAVAAGTLVGTPLAARGVARAARRARTARAAGAHGVSAAEAVELGGVRQWIALHGEDRTKPVLLVLHGGPGMPFPAGVAYRGYSPLAVPASPMAGHFVLAYWDQRGTGKSGLPRSERDSVSLDQLVADALELTDLLRDRFGQERIYLAGISWGTAIGLAAAQRAPERYHAYAGMAQIVNWTGSDRLALAWVLERARQTGQARALEELAAIGPPPWTDFRRWSVLRKWLMRLGGFVHVPAGAGRSLPGLLAPILTSPDYTLGDVIGLFPKLAQVTRAHLRHGDFVAIDFTLTAPRLELPVLFFHGQHDRAVAPDLTRDYVKALDAPFGKRFVALPDSAHFFSPGDARAVEADLVRSLPTLRH